MWGVGPSQTCLPVWSNQGALGHMSWTQACGPHPRFQAEPPLTPGCIEVGTSWHFSKKVKTRPTSAKQAVGDRKYDQPEVATEMCRVSESLVPQWPSTGPQGPQASQFFFSLPRSREKHAEGLLCNRAERARPAPLLPFTTEHVGHEEFCRHPSSRLNAN